MGLAMKPCLDATVPVEQLLMGLEAESLAVGELEVRDLQLGAFWGTRSLAAAFGVGLK